jgi:hypothetical protein
VVTAPSGFQLSLDGTTWSSNVTLTQTAGTIPVTTINVRLNATTAGNYSGNITHTSTGATTINLPVTGTAVNPPSITVTQALTQFMQVSTSPSISQSYTVSGSSLTGNITITAPYGYEFSTDNGITWQKSSVTLIPTNGTVPATIIKIRLFGVATGNYPGNLVHSSMGVTSVSIPLAGYIVTKSTYAVYPVPAYRVVYISHPRPVKGTTITIFTATGERLKVVNAQPDTFETPIDVSLMRNGLYFVEVNAENEKTILRFIKE